jgi:DNA-binding winged helix-turn-helix (wHTH) protein
MKTNGSRDTETETETEDLFVGEWRVSPGLNQVSRKGKRVQLQHLSMAMLLYLAKRPGQAVTYEELLEELWPGRIVGDNSVHQRIADLRRKMPTDDKFIENISKKGYRLVAPVRPVTPDRQIHFLYPGIAVAAIVLAVVAFFLTRSGEPPPQEPAPTEPTVVKVAIETAPPGAMVSFKPYDEPDAEWQPLGVSPLEAELPTGAQRLRFIADGRAPVIMAAPNPSRLFNNVGRDFYVVELPLASDVPDGMVFIPAGNLRVPLLGYYRDEDLGDFFIGRTEVSNREYAEFVDAGGYDNYEYWQHLEDADAGLTFAVFRERFVDSTGHPGPAPWVNGGYPNGGERLPVTGVSWYEAMAFAKFRGMKLPTARLWARAALGINEGRWPLAPHLLSVARINSAAPGPVDDDIAMSTWGAINMIGNVQEWTTTRNGDARLTLGTSFAGPQWQYAMSTTSLPEVRLPDQGFRLALYGDDVADPEPSMSGRVPDVPEATPEELAQYRAEYAYEAGAVTARAVSKEFSVDDHDWIRERYVFESNVLTEPLPVLVFRPRESAEPLQPVIFLPPGDSYQGSFPSDDIDITRYGIDFVVRNGRALVWPIIAGTHERPRPRDRPTPAQLIERWRDLKRVRRQEIGAVIDFLEFNDDFDGNRVALLAASFGATFVSPHVLMAEERIRTGVMMSATLAQIDTKRFPDIVNPNTYWPHVTQPILLLNGRYDISTHLVESRVALLESVGTNAGEKRGIVYDSSHWPLPPHRVEQDVTGWLDEHLGPVGQKE